MTIDHTYMVTYGHIDLVPATGSIIFMPKLKPKASIDIDVYRIISQAVEDGIAYGYNRAHKHTDEPDKDTLLSQLHDSVMFQLGEYVRWPD